MKKLSMYFFASVFFIAIWPKECDWPNPNEEDAMYTSTTQPTLDTNSVDIIIKQS